MAARFAGVSQARLELMALAGAEITAAERAFARQQTSVVARLLRDEGTFFEWDHFPPGDIYDPVSGAQYFYHAHGTTPRRVGEGKFHNLMPAAHGGAQRPAEEHGHFHTFLRDPGLRHPETPTAPSHVIAIAMDFHGRPNRLFTVNRWVTEETWTEAPRLIAMLDRFTIDLPRPSRWVNRWLAALLRLFRPQIEDLLRQRDAALAEWGRLHPGENPRDSRELEIPSQIEISLAGQIDQVARALSQPRRKAR
jgi:hypothetical protein